MSQQPAWMAWPLPPGWEGRYDANSKKYFFINHQTHATQWTDPRIEVWEQQQRQFQQQQAPGHAQQDSYSSSRGLLQEPASEPEQPAYAQRDLDKLTSQFPDVSASLRVTTLTSTSGDITRAASLLKDMGYSQRSALGPYVPEDNLVGDFDEDETEEEEEFEFEAAEIDFGPSIEEQEARIKVLKRSYHLVDELVIKMACDAASWDEAIYLPILDGQKKEAEQEAARRAAVAARMAAMMDSTPVAPVTQYTDEYSLYSEEEEPEPCPQYAQPSRSMTDSNRTREARQEQAAARQAEQKARKKEREERQKKDRVERAAKNKPKKKTPRSNAPRPARTQGTAPVYTSDLAMGRDPSLAQGCDRNLLTTREKLSNGRDPALTQGRDPTLSHGRDRALAQGRDPSLLSEHGVLSCGRDVTLAVGRDTSLLITSSG